MFVFPYNCIYVFCSFNSIDVTGLLLAGDGSGGRNSMDLRTRRCGFGLAIIRYSSNLEDCKLIGHARGSVPGKQSVPRAEAAALLFALLHTIGCAFLVCDSLGVCKRFWGLRNKTRSKDNGLLWLHIANAIESRLSKGHGMLEVVWMPSHTSYEHALTLDLSLRIGWPTNAPTPWLVKLQRKLQLLVLSCSQSGMGIESPPSC